ncbi:MAG: DEAD/DEAH box helicase [Clostridia bacterium]|nr:DEAD/DEAH box helicase [Clostridia bacterium]
MSEKSFASLGLSAELMRAIEDAGYSEMTDIQAEAIPHILEGEDIIGQSSTGTGKTAAFGIPGIERLRDDAGEDPQMLVLCPTRELAMQVSDELRKFSKYKEGVRIVAVYGGQNIDNQIRALKNGVSVVVGTPGRIIDHLHRHTLSLKSVRYVVLDEADEMLNMGFLDDIRYILGASPRERQTALFSATMPPPILRISQRFQREPHHIKGDDGQTAFELIEQFYCEVPRNKKSGCAGLLFKQSGAKRGLIFCNTKIMVDILTRRLCEMGLNACAIHGDMRQGARTQVMSGFKSGKVDLLVATDVAARGIDASDVEIIINYDIPEDVDYYVHRIGRTGRAGKQGASYTLVAGSGEFFDMANVQQATGVQMKEYILEGIDELPEEKKRSEGDKKPARANSDSRRRDSGAKSSARGEKKSSKAPTGTLTIDVGAEHDVQASHVIEALQKYGKVRREDIGKINIRPQQTTVDLPASKLDAILSAMQESNATVNDFLVQCAVVKNPE